MILKPLRRADWCAAGLVLLLLVFPGKSLFARGGSSKLQWGYSPRDGNPVWNMYWQFASPWGAMNGWSIPHHNLDAPPSGAADSASSSFSPGRDGAMPKFDRSLMFPGSSSNPTPLMPSVTRPVPTAPYRTDKEFEPPYYRNYDGYWINGYWGGGEWGWGRWGGSLGVTGFPRWMLGPVYYTSGYGLFSNPFVAGKNVHVPEFLDYSKPIENLDDDDVPPTGATESSATGAADSGAISNSGAPSKDESPAAIANYLLRSPEVKAGMKAFDAAGEAFKKKDYDLALRQIDEALEKLPVDPALHQFRGLVLFALGDYQQSAAIVYAVLAVSPGWDWTTLSSRYADQEEFPRQLRVLETHHKQNPDSAAAAFLRGYYYTTCRHTQPAVKQFQNAVELLPDDELLPSLLALIQGALEKSPAVSSSRTPTAQIPRVAADKPQSNGPLEMSKLVGDWKASRGGEVKISLTLRDDQHFVWVATRNGTSRRIAGRFALAGNMLFLAGGSGALVGNVEPRDHGGFNFKLHDNDTSHPGLDFTRGGK